MRGCASFSSRALSPPSMFSPPPPSSSSSSSPSPSTALLFSPSTSVRQHRRSRRSYASYPPHTALGMPALSPTMSHGNLAVWHVKVGDEVSPGDALADVETDKAVLAWENQDDGFVAALLRPDGSKDIPVGAPLLILVEEKADVAKFEGYRPQEEGGGAEGAAAAAAAAAPAAAASASSASSSAAAASPASSSSSSSPARLIGPAAARILRQAGLSLSAGSSLPATGPKGTLTKEDAVAAVAAAKSGAGGSGGSSSSSSSAAKPAAAASSSAAAAPKKAAAAAAARAPPLGALPPPRPGAEFEDVPHSQMRRVIASRLSASKAEVPHAYYRADADLTALTRLRASLKSKGGGGKPPSVNDFVIAAAARALRAVPALNVSFDAAAAASPEARPTPSESVDVCVAVATEGGLITPIVRGADAKGAAAISAEVADLASRARAGKLRPEEFTGGSFTISNLGMFGVSHFSAIINPPQAAILAVGGARQEAAEVEGGGGGGKRGGRGGGGGGGGDARSLVFVPRLALTLSVDARAVDGDSAGAWLDAFAAALAEPETLLQ